jgi:biotin carboxyl carrier protein
MYKVIAGDKTHHISLKQNEVSIDNKAVDLDLIPLRPNHYHLLLDHKSYNLEVVSINNPKSEVLVKVNNKDVKLVVKTEMDELLSKMGLNNNHSSKAKNIGAPMPGLILDIVVNEGDEVKKGDKLLILEAMKMENIIKAPGDGKIKSIIVSKGESVDSGQKLIHFE